MSLTARLIAESPIPLNEEQRKILLALARPNCRFVVVEGPPGTGKSHTISAIAFEAIRTGKSVLILADKAELSTSSKTSSRKRLRRFGLPRIFPTHSCASAKRATTTAG